MVNVVIPMAGLGSRFANEGFLKPKPFIDVAGIPMIVRVLENLRLPSAKYILIARREHLDEEHQIVGEIEKNFNCIFIPIDEITEGTACTILHAESYINNNTPLLIANSDQIVDIEISDFLDDCEDRNLDGSILTFIEESRNQKWSYAEIDNNGFVIRVREKEAISDIATVGVYFFSRGSYFHQSCNEMIANNDRVNNEFYTCPIYNYAIKSNKKIGVFNIDKSKMHGLGTPNDLKKYLEVI